MCAEIPPPPEREQCLYDYWARIDAWIENHTGRESGRTLTTSTRGGGTRLSDVDRAAAILSGIDEYYRDLHEGEDRAASQLVRQLGRPRPRDIEVTRELSSYKQLAPRWHDWDAVVEVLASVARAMVEQ
jgi:hypothetical protein